MTYQSIPALDKIRRYPLHYLGLLVAFILLVPGLFSPQNILPLIDAHYEFATHAYPESPLNLWWGGVIIAYLAATVILLPLNGKRTYQVASFPFFAGAVGIVGYNAFILATATLEGFGVLAIYVLAVYAAALAIMGGMVLLLVYIERHIASPWAAGLLLILLIIGCLLEVPYVRATLEVLEDYRDKQTYSQALVGAVLVDVEEAVTSCQNVDVERFNLGEDGPAKCISLVAKTHQDPSLCNRLPDEARQLDCKRIFYQTASLDQRIQVCLEATTIDNKDGCLFRLIIPSDLPKSDVVKICSLMSDVTRGSQVSETSSYKKSCLESAQRRP